MSTQIVSAPHRAVRAPRKTVEDRAAIDRFLAGRRLAFVGVSTHADDFSRVVFRELVAHGYDVVPVHPGVAEIEGRIAFASVHDVPGALDGVFVMTPAAVSEQIVRASIARGVRRIWLHRGAGPGAGAVDPAAVALARAQGVEVVAGECPLMFLASPAWVHRAHASIRRAEGLYPRLEPAVRRPPRPAWIAAAGVLAWAACAAIMAGLLAVTSTGAAIAIHAAAAPLVFAAIAYAYARLIGDAAPLTVAGVMTAIAVVLDVAVVAGLIQRSAALVASGAGFWLPLALGAIAATVGGVRGARARAMQRSRA